MNEKTETMRPEEPAQPTMPVAGGAATAAPANPVEVLDREAKIIEALRTIYDPEIPVDIYELGLVYDLRVEPAGPVNVRMTLTTPNCPEAVTIPSRVESAVRAVPGVTDVKVEIVWDPPWTPQHMTEAAKLQLGFL